MRRALQSSRSPFKQLASPAYSDAARLGSTSACLNIAYNAAALSNLEVGVISTALAQPLVHTRAASSSAQQEAPAAGPGAKYWAGRKSGAYRGDPRQEHTIALLQDLYTRLEASIASRPKKASNLTMVDALADQQHKHHHAGSKGAPKKAAGSFWSGITSFIGNATASSSGAAAGGSGAAAGMRLYAEKGLYMFGGVGCGKTMLMDLFVNTAPAEFHVTRTHFHDFMLDVHAKLRQFKGDTDPLLRVADQLAKTTHVLALDEVFVTDVADAMILNRLFGRLWDRGVVLVATSNRHPDKLYENGLQRALFMPFIHRLKAECVVHDMASPTDYRKLAQHQKGLYFVTPQREEELYEAFVDLAGPGAAIESTKVDVKMGRTIDVPRAAGKACMFSFSDLCGRPVAAADYIALAENYHTLALSGVPVFNAANRSEAYRFVTLIDVMYEHRMRLLISAEALPFELFHNIVTQSEAAATPGLKDQAHIVVDDNLGFAKDRTVSRLTEAQSVEYLLAHAKQHVPENVLALEEAAEKLKAARAAAAAAGQH